MIDYLSCRLLSSLKPDGVYFRSRVSKASVWSLLTTMLVACGGQKPPIKRVERLEGAAASSANSQVLTGTKVLKTTLMQEKANNSEGECQPSPPESTTQRITRLEYDVVMRESFGLTGSFANLFNVPMAGSLGYTTDGSAQNLSPAEVKAFTAAATQAAKLLVARSPAFFPACNGTDACTKSSLKLLLETALRRDVSTEEIERYFALTGKASDKSFAGRMELAARAAFLSPDFIYRMPRLRGGAQPDLVPLSSDELASRLSFFIWGAAPDQNLRSLAREKKLDSPEVLASEVKRLLADPKSNYFTRTFVSEWLELSHLDSLELDKARFPLWTPKLKESMKREPIAFFEALVREDRSVLELVRANYSYVDGEISPLYGLSLPTGAPFSKVTLDASRRGILTQPAILAMNSAGDHTVPVKRGKWVLERLLCSSPPPPPPNIPVLAIPSNGELSGESSIRKRLEVHRTSGPSCQACHSSMDPFGLSLENFDSSGAFRSHYIDGVIVDASAILADGRRIEGGVGLASTIESDSRFTTCFATHLSTFALGRDLSSESSRCSVSTIVKRGISKDSRLSDLIVAIVTSPEFRFRSDRSGQ